MLLTPDLVKRAGNQALNINPPPAGVDIHLTSHGSDWLWAVFALFALSALVHAAVFIFTKPFTLSVTEKAGLNGEAVANGTAGEPVTGRNVNRLFFVYPLFIHAVLAYTYFTYASNLGYTSTPVEFNHIRTSLDLGVRQVFYVKYIGWFLAWPFVLTIFEISTHTLEQNAATWVTAFITLFQSLITKLLATEVFVLGLLIGALIDSSYRWGYFTFAITAQLFAISLVGSSVFESARVASTTGVSSKRSIGHFLIYFQFIVWILYPVAWALSEGGNVIQPDSEAVFYGILDLLNFLVIPSILTWHNVRTVDGTFFNKVTNFGNPLRRKLVAPTEATDAEKSIGETPRHSGDTAVPHPVNERVTADPVLRDDAAGQTYLEETA